MPISEAAATLGAAGLGSFGSIIGTAFSNAQSGHQARKNMRLQAALNYAYAKKAALNAPSWNRTGLEDAGYNPMLAVQNATSGANSSWSGLNNTTVGDYGHAISEGIANAQSFQHLENETRQTIANSGQAFATAENQKADAANKRAENPYISKRAEAEIGKLEQDTAYTKALQDNIKVEQDLRRELANIDYAGRKYSADSAYNATTYHANTLKRIADEHSPSSRSQSFRNYMEGVTAPMHGIGSLLHGYSESNNYNNDNESTTTYYDKDGNVRGSVSRSGSSKGSSSKHSRKHR